MHYVYDEKVTLPNGQIYGVDGKNEDDTVLEEFWNLTFMLVLKKK